MTDYIPVLVALIAGPLAVLVTVYFSRDKVRADASKTLTDISLSLVEPQQRALDRMQVEITELKTKVRRLESENRALHTWAQLLFSQVVEAGHEPIPFESEWLPGEDTDG